MDRQEIINDYVTDMAAVEKHILEAVERQIGTPATKDFPEALAVLNDVRTTLARHVSALEGFNEDTRGGGLKETLKEAVTGTLGVAAGIYNKIRQEDQVSRMVRDTYTALGLATISYNMMYTTALGLKEDRLAQIALDHLKDLSPLVVDLSKTVCLVVAHELSQEDKLIDPAIGQEAVRRTHEAWSSQNVGSGDGGTVRTSAAATAP
ncbi:MAG TPA: hypothetical protein VK002_13045 [Rubricoccaceae bacterium]|jgi:hypothetical protein|nr:hypothetical protein [Rubricoccaceae bacterium]